LRESVHLTMSLNKIEIDRRATIILFFVCCLGLFPSRSGSRFSPVLPGANGDN
jgi:hypothetical protein